MIEANHNALEKKPGERDYDYHKRLIFGKLVDHTLSDYDYSEIAEKVYGKQYSSDHARKCLYGSKHTLDLLDSLAYKSIDSDGIITEIDAKRIELEKERRRLFDQRTAFNKLIRERARQEELNDVIVRAVNSGTLPVLDYTAKDATVSIEPSNNDLLVTLADLHYGIVVHNAWTDYDPDICVEMLRKYLDGILDIARTHNSENCYVFGLGDFISGSIHLSIALANRENTIAQVMSVSEIVAEFITELSKHFLSVRFMAVSGNHSRIAKRDDALMEERLDDLVSFYLKARLANIASVFIEEEVGDKIDCSMFAVNIRGLNYLGVHGDYDTSQANIAILPTMAQRPIYAIICGHKHHSYSEYVQGVRVVMTGSFVAMDEYAVSRRLYSEPEQTVCVCDSGGIRCTYNVPL